MEKFIDLLYDFAKAQLAVHGDQIVMPVVFLSVAMALIYLFTSILKGYLKRYKHRPWYDPTVRLALVPFGVASMFIHGAFFPGAFDTRQKILGGVVLAALNFAIYHVRKWWASRKSK